jgi:predicted nucleotidyltransferase
MTEELQSKIQQAASELIKAGAREVYLFGSAVRDEIADPGDIDLAVTGIAPAQFFAAMAAAAHCLDRPLDLIDLDDDSPLVRYLRDKGNLRRVA